MEIYEPISLIEQEYRQTNYSIIKIQTKEKISNKIEKVNTIKIEIKKVRTKEETNNSKVKEDIVKDNKEMQLKKKAKNKKKRKKQKKEKKNFLKNY